MSKNERKMEGLPEDSEHLLPENQAADFQEVFQKYLDLLRNLGSLDGLVFKTINNIRCRYDSTRSMEDNNRILKGEKMYKATQEEIDFLESEMIPVLQKLMRTSAKELFQLADKLETKQKTLRKKRSAIGDREDHQEPYTVRLENERRRVPSWVSFNKANPNLRKKK